VGGAVIVRKSDDEEWERGKEARKVAEKEGKKEER